MPHFIISFPIPATLNLRVEADTDMEAVEDAAELVRMGVGSTVALESAVHAISVDGFTLEVDCQEIDPDAATVTDPFDL